MQLKYYDGKEKEAQFRISGIMDEGDGYGGWFLIL